MRPWLQTLCACLVLFAAPAFGHGGHDERIKITRSEHSLWFDAYIEAGELSQFDSNRDGVLDTAEFTVQSSDIKAWIRAHLTVRQGNGEPLNPAFFDTPYLRVSGAKNERVISHVRVLQTYENIPQKSLLAISVKLYGGSGSTKKVMVKKGGKIQSKSYPIDDIRILLN